MKSTTKEGVSLVKSYEDLKTELIEIAGIIEKYPDDVKKQAFDLLVSRFLGEPIASIPNVKEEIPVPPKGSPAPKKKAATRAAPKTAPKTTKKKASTESYKIDRNLDLRAGADSPSFTEFYDEKSPSSRAEFNALAAYYLIKMKGHKEATLNQAYTCYFEVKKKPAEYFKQSFRDTQNKQGYIEFTEDGNIVIPHRGVVFIEHDLPKPKKVKK